MSWDWDGVLVNLFTGFDFSLLVCKLLAVDCSIRDDAPQMECAEPMRMTEGYEGRIVRIIVCVGP